MTKLSSFSNSLAHPEELLTHHLINVVDEGLKTARGTTERIEKAVSLLGLLHDVGKATTWFQERVQDKTNKKDRRSHHARLSSLLANHLISNINLSEKERTWLRYTITTGIAKHHTNLTESPQTTLLMLKQNVRDDTIFHEQLKNFHFEGFESWLGKALSSRGFSTSLPTFTTDAIFDSIKEVSHLFDEPFTEVRDGVEFIIAWGIFLGADKLRAALPDWQPTRITIPTEAVSAFKKHIFGATKTNLNQLREDIFKEILSTLERNPNEKFYTITAPTGSGKTLAGLAAGLFLKKVKEVNEPSRLIYCLPFTSIIDQNSKVYQDVLENIGLSTGTDVLLTHHHLTELSYRVGDEYIEDGADLLVETWQSEIIVTTFYQLVYTLFTTKNKMSKRITALKNAVVILDEVQAIPYRYWDDVYKMFRLISEILGTTFVLMTATMPLIFPPKETVELLPSHPKYFEGLARSEILNQTNVNINFEELVEQLKKDIEEKTTHSRIIILNRRGLVRDLYHSLEEKTENVWMLSTDLTPKDRRNILSQLKNSYTLVTTQVVEAGVDISSPEVWRDIAPLDSIIQSAGRCNRNSETSRGIVRLFKLVDEKDRMTAIPPYDGFLIRTSLDVLTSQGDTICEDKFHRLSQQYYERLKIRSEQANIMRYFADGNIHKLNDKKEGFQLMSEIPQQSYFIIQGDRDREIWEQYLTLENESDFFKRRRNFRSMKKEFMERIVNQLNLNVSTEIVPVYPKEGLYNSKTGLLPGRTGYEIL